MKFWSVTIAIALVLWSVLAFGFGVESWHAAAWTLGILMVPVVLLALALLVVAVLAAFDDERA